MTSVGEDKPKYEYEHNTVITAYLIYDVISERIIFPLCAFFTLFFIVQKLNDNLMAQWQATFYPLYACLIWNFIKAFYSIVKSESKEEEGMDEPYSYRGRLRVKNLDKIVLISNFFSLLFSSLGIMMIFYLGEFLDKRKDEYMFTSLYMVMALCVSQVLYSILRKSSVFSFAPENSENGGNSTMIGFLSSITGPLLTYFSSMMIVCSGSAGVCTQIYMSTIASLLGAFGVTLSDFSNYLFPITVILLGISLFSLYIKKKSFTHKPFLLGVFSTFLIIISHLFNDTSIYYLIYPGNILMIISAIWNARVNKFYGLPRFGK